MLMVGMYWPELHAFAEASKASGDGLVYNGGPASVLCSFPNPNQNNLGYLFMTEFFVDSYIVSARTSLSYWCTDRDANHPPRAS